MTVYFHVDLIDASIFRRKVKLMLPDDATVSDALAAYAEKYNANDVFKNSTGMVVVVNGARGSMQQVLRHEDRVRVFKPRIRG